MTKSTGQILEKIIQFIDDKINIAESEGSSTKHYKSVREEIISSLVNTPDFSEWDKNKDDEKFILGRGTTWHSHETVVQKDGKVIVPLNDHGLFIRHGLK